MKKMFLAALLTIATLTAMAVPAKRGLWKTLTLANGTTVQATLVGDEFGHYYMAADGQAYQESTANDGIYRPVNAETINRQASARRAKANGQRMKRLAPRKVGTFGNYTGKKKCVIILVNYSDTKFNSSNNKALYERIANEKNFSSGDFVGSMYDYFYDQSDGQFELTFDVVGPVTVSKKMSYYGSNDSEGNDEHAAEMVIEAVKLADSQVNFADYDWDGDGYVDQIYVVYAGKGEADGGAKNTIWPHAFDLDSANYWGDGTGKVKCDGVYINAYACGGELDGTTGKIAGIGTMCHEFSHCLGYPDFYDTDYSGGWGMDVWDLMSAGSYNGNGYIPAGYTAYERWMAGWRTPIELSATQSVTGMKPLTSGGESYIIYNDGNRNEYYMLENRKQESWDAGLPGSGLLIVHVDYSASVWNSNEPNDDPSHQRMTWVAADNSYQYVTSSGSKYLTDAGLATDLYPIASNNTFSNTSTPAATLFNNNTDGTKYLNKSVEQITKSSDGTISFRFRGVSSTADPVFSPQPGTYLDAQTVTITCATNGAQIYYTTDGTTPTTESTLYVAPFVVSQTTTVMAIAVKDGDESSVVTAKYKIGDAVDKFVKVTSADQLVAGEEYIIISPNYDVAAGPKADGSSYLTSVSATISGNEATSADAVVFTLVGKTDAWGLKADAGYLYSARDKAVAFQSAETTPWTISVTSAGATLSPGTGTLQYNSGSPRFTVYSSTQKPAYLYVRAEEEVKVQTVATPVITPEEGTYTERQRVTITCATEGATIYYTLDETDPTTRSTRYTGPFTIGMTEDIVEVRAIAVKDGWEDSEVASVVYLFEESVDVATPTFNYESGEYAKSLTDVTISCETDGAAIHYTTDGSTPTANSPEYTDPLTVSSTSTLKAVAYVGNSHSDMAEVTLTISANNSQSTGKTLLYEGFSGYTGSKDESSAIATSDSKLDYKSWTTFTNIYFSGNATADNGGHGKLGTGKKNGTMVAEGIALTGDGTLTFLLRQYSNDTGKLNLTVTGATADVTQFTPSSDWTLCTVNLTGASGNVSITFTTSSKRAYIDEINLAEVAAVQEDPIEQTVGVTGYSTIFYSDKHLIVPDGVEATTWYVADGQLTKGRTYKPGQKIPAGEAVVLYDGNSLDREYSFEVASSCSDTPDPNNMLHGFDEDGMTAADPATACRFYKFSFKGRDAAGNPTNIGFYYGAADGAAFMSAAHKAYLAVPESVMAGAPMSAFLFPGTSDDQPTGIEAIGNSQLTIYNSSAIYDLQGRKVTVSPNPSEGMRALTPGIYIRNGKKFVVR